MRGSRTHGYKARQAQRFTVGCWLFVPVGFRLGSAEGRLEGALEVGELEGVLVVGLADGALLGNFEGR